MKLLKRGELYSFDKRATPEHQYEIAVKSFVKKHKHEPLGACWCPLPEHVGKLDLPIDKTIPPGHLWLDLDDKAKD